MSLTSTLFNARSGLSVAQYALDVTAHNVANVNSPGYARKIAQQEAVVADGRGAGARAKDAIRAADDFLTGRLHEQQARVARLEPIENARSVALERIFGAPGEGSRGLNTHLTKLMAAAEALAGSSSSADKRAFVGAAQNAAQAITEAGKELQRLRQDADAGLGDVVRQVNRDIASLHELNRQIGLSGATAELLDRQDSLLGSLTSNIDASYHRDASGLVSVYARGSQPLLDVTPRGLSYEPASLVTSTTPFGPIRLARLGDIDQGTGVVKEGAPSTNLVSGGIRAELTAALEADSVPDATQLISSPLRSGKLQGLLEVRDRVLPKIMDQVSELAGTLQHALNAAHNAAVPLPPPSHLVGTRRDFGDPIAASLAGRAYLTVVDSATGKSMATLEIDVAGLGSPADLAAQITASLGGHVAAGINGDGALELTAAAGFGLALNEGDSSIGVEDAAGVTRHYGFSHFFGLNDLLVGASGEPTALAVRADIGRDSGKLGQAVLDIARTPTLAATLGGKGDRRGAAGLAAAFERAWPVARSGDLPPGEYRITDYAAEITAAVATAAADAAQQATGERALAEDLATRRSNISGVNLDEELARMVVYQQAYSVSARVLAVVDELFDQLLAIGR